MSSMNSARTAFRRHRDEKAYPPLWLVAVALVSAVVVTLVLANLALLPTFSADDAGSILFSQG